MVQLLGGYGEIETVRITRVAASPDYVDGLREQRAVTSGTAGQRRLVELPGSPGAGRHLGSRTETSRPAAVCGHRCGKTGWW